MSLKDINYESIPQVEKHQVQPNEAAEDIFENGQENAPSRPHNVIFEVQHTKTVSSLSTLQIVILNIVGFILGYLILWLGFPLVMQGLAYVISIPVLGDLIRFGVEPTYIVFPYSAWIVSAIAGWVCFKICSPTQTDKRIGMILLGIAGAIQYTYATISLFRHNGFEFVFIIFALSALFAVSYYFILGLGKY